MAQLASQNSESTGMVLSLQDFTGVVEMINNTVSNNFAFIPSAILSNNQKFNQTVFNPPFTTFVTNSTVLEMEIKDTTILNHNIHFLNYFDPRSSSESLLKYETQSPIMLRNVMGSHILFINNTFQDNVGLHGGAINIDF